MASLRDVILYLARSYLMNTLPYAALFGVVPVLLTDHYHQHVTPLAETAYVLWQKQCYPLDGDAPLHNQLVQMGYLREEAPSPS